MCSRSRIVSIFNEDLLPSHNEIINIFSSRTNKWYSILDLSTEIDTHIDFTVMNAVTNLSLLPAANCKMQCCVSQSRRNSIWHYCVIQTKSLCIALVHTLNQMIESKSFIFQRICK